MITKYSKLIPFIKEPLRQIECEFAKFDNGRIRDIFIDFSKLVLGAAPNKLFIGSCPKIDNKQNYKTMVLNIAHACKGTVFFALMPHPGTWNLESSRDGQVELWKLTENWTPML